MFLFTLEKTKGHARAGHFLTPHGTVKTPIFMPVGTAATVKSLDSKDIQDLQAQIILANTYHLYLRPGMKHLEQLGGVHQFMKWSGPMLTDSGGFQVFSLGKQMEERETTFPSAASSQETNLETKEAKGLATGAQGTKGVKVKGGGPPEPFARISDEGVEFRSHLDGTKHFFSPETSIEIQRQIGADIIMAFDECTPDGATSAYTLEALDRTHRWAAQCKEYWEARQRKSTYGQYQALFGIIQGSDHQELREQSARAITALDFDGNAIGGETIGYNMQKTVEIMDWIRNILPEQKPRYAMGLGRDPQNIIDAVMAGYDMFDCVAPTRLARNGALYSGKIEVNATGDPVFVSEYGKGRLQIGNAVFSTDPTVIQPGCDCYTCNSGYSRAYLNHLFKTQELTYYRLASIHNVRFMVRLTEQLRDFILR